MKRSFTASAGRSRRSAPPPRRRRPSGDRLRSAPDLLKLPDDIYLGEAAGVATNSKGDIFVYTRTGHPTVSLGASRTFAHGGSRLFEFDPPASSSARSARASTASCTPQQVRIDPQDNIWVVDQMIELW